MRREKLADLQRRAESAAEAAVRDEGVYVEVYVEPRIPGDAEEERTRVFCDVCHELVGYAEVPLDLKLRIECASCAQRRTWVVDVHIPREGGYTRWERSNRMTQRAAQAFARDKETIGFRARAVEMNTPPPAEDLATVTAMQGAAKRARARARARARGKAS